ncbi:MAG TPA: M20/M25/M40 family metallo-hydrolase [Pyrinomonadaceae bacterium]|nr:M20/M25/M40 family metallo-hydrolase [Pyrinomonadaceae bacterium]
MKKRLSLIPLLLAVALSVAAQQPDRIQKDVKYLASDTLEGRRTGTKGATEAARYMAKEFSRLKLKPLSTGYRQKFPYVAAVTLGKTNTLTFGTDKLEPSVDWLPLGFSSSARVSGGLVFVGYGITASELNHNDYATANATGKIAIALQGTPDGANPHGRFIRFEGVRWKAVAAKNAGAKALIVIAREANFKDDRLTRLAYDNMSGDAGLPVIIVSRHAADRLLALSGFSLSKLEPSAATRALTGEINLTTDLVRKEVPAYNVIGMLEGSDPLLKKEVIIIGAHYDHLGRGGEGSGSLAPTSGDIHYGADDNASGTAGVLELARLFTTQNPKPKRTIVFMGFGGEEEGLLGSNYYVNHPLLPLANTVAMINMDMIGRMKDRRLVVGGVGTAKEWRDIMAADTEKAFQLTLNEDGFGPSDHSSFYAKQIPVLFFWTGTHNDYHKPSDTFEKINYDDQVLILKMVARIVNQLDAADKRLTYTTAKSDAAPRTGGFRVYLGTIPNYADSNDGLLIDGVRDDSPAAKAGIKAGDKIVRIGTREIKNVYDYTAALGEMKANEEYAIEVMRGTERLTLKLKPEARR